LATGLREYWGKGVASAALSLFLAHVTIRPLTARREAQYRVCSSLAEMWVHDFRDTFSSQNGAYGEEYIFMIGTDERIETFQSSR
jgi:hypothetical protein